MSNYMPQFNADMITELNPDGNTIMLSNETLGGQKQQTRPNFSNNVY